MHAARLPASIDRFPVVFEAAGDAPLGGSLVDLKVRQVLTKEAKQANRTPAEGAMDIVSLVRGPNNTDMYMTTVDRLAVSAPKRFLSMPKSISLHPYPSKGFHEPKGSSYL